MHRIVCTCLYAVSFLRAELTRTRWDRLTRPWWSSVGRARVALRLGGAHTRQIFCGKEVARMDSCEGGETKPVVDGDKQTEAPVAKRGRGRPKKTDSAAVPGKKRPQQDVADSADVADAADAAPPPAKRGRGRPKKADSAAAVPGTGTTGDESSGGGASAKRGRGRPKKNGVGDSTTDGGQPSTAAGKKKAGQDSADGGIASKMAMSKAASGNQTNWEKVEISRWNDFSQTADGRKWTKKFSTWNVNGVRAWLKNGGLAYIQHEDPDIFCLQETKCSESDLPKDQLDVAGYHNYWYSADKKGYSGTGLYTKTKPLNVTHGIGADQHDNEGRLITLEFEKFYFLTAYVPNAGEGLKRLSYRQEWDVDFRGYLKGLDAEKPVILCGDLNVAHNAIDLANPQSNTHSAGFTKEEREGFTLLLNEGFKDSFRHVYPDRTGAYTYWSYRMNARARNTGWRLDYFVISDRLTSDLCDCVIRNEVYGSDHCPLVLAVALD